MLVIKDFATTTLAAALTAGATSIVVSDASRLPTLSAGDHFYLVLQKFTDRSYVEIVKVTGISSNTLTVVRAQAGTTAKAFAIADYAELRLTKGTFDEYLAQMIAGKVDMTSGYVSQKLDLLNTADSVKGGVGVVYDDTDGHGTVLSGGEGANKRTPHILLRPLGMADASVQAKYGSDGSLILTGGSRYVETGLLSMKHPSDTYGWPNNTVNDANNFANRARGKIHVGNNALYFIADAGVNARRFGIQSGHEHPGNTTSYGTLDLNPFGGVVRVNGGTVYHTGYVPTPAAVGALALSGGILTGHLEQNMGGYGACMTAAGGVAYLQGGKVGGDTTDQKLKITGISATALTEFEILTAGHGVAKVNGARIYTEQYVPTPAVLGAVPQARTINSKPLTSDITLSAADVGAVAKVGDTMTGGLTFVNADCELGWVFNADYAKIGFKNIDDGDTDSYMWFKTGDNGNEYFKWQGVSGANTTDWMSLKSTGLVVAAGVTAPTFTGALAGNAATATKLATARQINGTNFDGSGNITTANWGTARTLTIGNTAKSVNGAGNVSWSLSEIGAVPQARTINTKPLTSDIVLSAADVGAVPQARTINSKPLTADITLSAADVGAAPEGFGLGEVQAFTVVDMDSDPLAWNGGKMGWIRAISSSINKPDDQPGVGLLHRYQSGASSVVHILFFGHNNKMYTRCWSGTAWSVWKSSFDSTNKPAVSDVTGLSDALSKAGGSPVLSSVWVQLRSAMWNGYVAADGQTLSRSLYPDAVAAIQAGLVPVCTDAEWLADPAKRGCFTLGDGSTTFRVPDYNGVQPGSYGPVYLGGGAGESGVILRDRIQNIKGDVGFVSGGVAVDGVFGASVDKFINHISATLAGQDRQATFDASRVARTGETTRPITAEGCLAIKLFGAVQNAGSADAAALATAVADLSARMSVLEQRKSTCLVNAADTGAPHETVDAQLPDRIAVNSRYVLTNPFGINTPVECWVEVFANNRWARTGWAYANNGGYGAQASYVQGEGIVVQTGLNAVLARSTDSGSGHAQQGALVSARCRVFVCRLEA